MKIIHILLIFGVFGSVFGAARINRVEIEENENPIIGVLAEEIEFNYLNTQYPGDYKSFIAASYVKFVEGGGARVVPIWIDKPRKYYEDIMSKINGVVFPGGAVWFNQTNGYSEAGRHIYEIASEMNDKGEYFPIWGTCLGFELLTYLSADDNEHRSDCSSDKQPLHLDFKDGFRQSTMFKGASDEIVNILSSEPVTSNFHHYCVTENDLKTVNIDDQWSVISTNKDWNGLEFISTLEHTKYPFYGVQFHPEKNLYEWIINRNISHTTNAIKAAQYFAEFFISESRKSFNSFANSTEEDKYVIYNYPTTFTGITKSIYEECYMFPADVDYRLSTGAAPSMYLSNYLIGMFIFGILRYL